MIWIYVFHEWKHLDTKRFQTLRSALDGLLLFFDFLSVRLSRSWFSSTTLLPGLGRCLQPLRGFGISFLFCNSSLDKSLNCAVLQYLAISIFLAFAREHFLRSIVNNRCIWVYLSWLCSSSLLFLIRYTNWWKVLCLGMNVTVTTVWLNGRMAMRLTRWLALGLTVSVGVRFCFHLALSKFLNHVTHIAEKVVMSDPVFWLWICLNSCCWLQIKVDLRSINLGLVHNSSCGEIKCRESH